MVAFADVRHATTDTSDGSAQDENQTSVPESQKVSSEDWAQTWTELVSEAAHLELECSAQVALLPEFPEDSDEDPMSGTRSSEWLMKDSLWGGLARIRADVRLVSSSPADAAGREETVHDITSRLKELHVQQEQQIVALRSAALELEKKLESTSISCNCWAMEPSTFSSLDVLLSPPWRGIRGGDGGHYSSGRMGLAASADSPLSWCQSEVRSRCIPGTYKDPVVQEIRTALAAIEEDVRQAGGPTGGWREVDHEIFQRIFRMFRRQSFTIICDRVCERLPSVSHYEVLAHIKWFFVFDKHQSSKRQLLAKWRQRLAHLEEQAALVQELSEDEEKRRSAGLRRSRSADQRILVGEWRRKQDEIKEHATNTERDQLQKQAQQQRGWNMKREQQIQQQEAALEEFRQQRAAAHEAEKQALAAELRRADLSPEARKRVRGRNDDLLRKLREQGQTCRRSHSQPTITTPKKSQSYQHVESKLYSPTKSFIQKMVAIRHLDESRESEQESASITCLAEGTGQMTQIDDQPICFEAVD